jgi:hypothetical protein
MSKDVAKSGQLGGYKLRIGDKDRDLFKRGLSLVVVIMCRVPCGHPGVTSRTFDQCCITSGGGS